MHVEKRQVSVTVNSSGDGTGYTENVTGRILSVIYEKASSGGYDNGVDFVVTVEETGQIIWDEDDVNASAIRAPRQPIHSQVGVAALYAGGGSPVLDHIVLANQRIKVVVASGGDTKTGTFKFLVG